MFDNKDYFPTPNSLIEKMLKDVNFYYLGAILEPSAGKGNIVDYINEKVKTLRSYRTIKPDIDCIEIDTNLRHILKGKGYRVVNDDFLSYNTYKSYSHIIANFPFSNGDKHLRKALDILEMGGGELICLVNAETIKNPYSNLRKEILVLLEKYNASIEFLQEEFIDAERKTNVEVALIKVKIEKKQVGSLILDELQQSKLEEEKEYETTQIVDNDFIKAIITQYEFELKVGMTLVDEYEKLKSFTRCSFDEDGTSALTLSLSGKYAKSDDTIRNGYIRAIRYKYWTALFNSKDFTTLLTTNLRWDFQERLDDLSNYDFNLFNIEELRKQMNSQVEIGVRETILKLFDEFSSKHYYNSDSTNIHMFNGWKTNKSWKINKKVITVLNAFDSYNGRFNINYNVKEKLSDIEKVFNYLDSGRTEEINLTEVLKQAEEEGQTKYIKTKFFEVTFYKKGSCHLVFLDMELLKKFNIFGAMNKNWLPPSYSKKDYHGMSKEEQEVIDEFEGRESYSKTMNEKEYYIYNPSNILLLA